MGRHTLHKDSGCEWYKDCFSCPFSDCVYVNDKQKSAYVYMTRARELADAGRSVKDIASILSKSKRTIQRYLVKVA